MVTQKLFLKMLASNEKELDKIIAKMAEQDAKTLVKVFVVNINKFNQEANEKFEINFKDN
jgi:hypothetical protein